MKVETLNLESEKLNDLFLTWSQKGLLPVEGNTLISTITGDEISPSWKIQPANASLPACRFREMNSGLHQQTSKDRHHPNRHDQTLQEATAGERYLDGIISYKVERKSVIKRIPVKISAMKTSKSSCIWIRTCDAHTPVMSDAARSTPRRTVTTTITHRRDMCRHR